MYAPGLGSSYSENTSWDAGAYSTPARTPSVQGSTHTVPSANIEEARHRQHQAWAMFSYHLQRAQIAAAQFETAVKEEEGFAGAGRYGESIGNPGLDFPPVTSTVASFAAMRGALLAAHPAFRHILQGGRVEIGGDGVAPPRRDEGEGEDDVMQE